MTDPTDYLDCRGKCDICRDQAVYVEPTDDNCCQECPDCRRLL